MQIEAAALFRHLEDYAPVAVCNAQMVSPYLYAPDGLFLAHAIERQEYTLEKEVQAL